MDKYTGKRLDARYEIQKLIGVGGMAVVYRAYDIIEDKIVALKILKDEFLGNEEFIRRFKNESKAIAVLSHPNIVKVFDVSLGSKIQYIVMEYIDGIALKEYLSQQKTIDWKDAIYFTKQILSALKHAHERGIIHRDIKPQNIMLLKNGSVKVTDFGIARFSGNETKTMMDRAIGSVHYISPEQAKGSVIDEKADVYSVGVMLYEMLTGKLPFEADNAVSVAIMQMQSKPKMPREINQDIPKGLEEITLHAMEKNPENRYFSTDAMLEDIVKFQNDPNSRFEYEYFVDNDPTKYVDAINNIKPNPQVYGEKDDNKKKKRAGIIASAIAGAVAIFAIIFILFALFNSCGKSGKDIEVPNFINMKWSEVENNPEYTNKFKFKIETAYDSTKPEGYIIDQEPEAGTKKVKEGATIVLKVNSAAGTLVTVPAVKGLTEEVAKSKLTNAELKFEVLMVEDSEIAVGIVKGSDPQESSKTPADSTVKLYVSKGAGTEKIAIPNVIDKSLTAAKNSIISAGFKVSDNVTSETSEKSKDIVIMTDPLPGVLAEKGSTIKLTISSGVKKEKTVEIIVDLPNKVGEVVVKNYVDGVLDITKTVDTNYSNKYPLKFKGTSGAKTIIIKINDQEYAIYEVDFDAGNSKLIKSNPYTPASTLSSQSVVDEGLIY